MAGFSSYKKSPHPPLTRSPFPHWGRLNVAITARLFFIQVQIYAGDFCKRRALNYPQAFSSGRRWRGEAVTDEVFFHDVKCTYSHHGLLMISAVFREGKSSPTKNKAFRRGGKPYSSKMACGNPARHFYFLTPNS